MTPDDLRRAGECLYGEWWQTPLAHALGITARHLRFWLSGERPIPSQRQDDILRKLESRKAEIDYVVGQIAISERQQPTAERDLGESPAQL